MKYDSSLILFFCILQLFPLTMHGSAQGTHYLMCDDISPIPYSTYPLGTEIQVDRWERVLTPYFDYWNASLPTTTIALWDDNEVGVWYIEEFTTTNTLRIHESGEYRLTRRRKISRFEEYWYCNTVFSVDDSSSSEALSSRNGVYEGDTPPDIEAYPEGSPDIYYTPDGELYRTVPTVIRNTGGSDLILYDFREWVSNDRLHLYPINFYPGMKIPPGEDVRIYIGMEIYDPVYLLENKVLAVTLFIKSNDPDPPNKPPIGLRDGNRVTVVYKPLLYMSEDDIPDYVILPPPNPDWLETANGVVAY